MMSRNQLSTLGPSDAELTSAKREYSQSMALTMKSPRAEPFLSMLRRIEIYHPNQKTLNRYVLSLQPGTIEKYDRIGCWRGC